MDLPIGYLLQDRYRVEALLGQGGFGKTYKVFDVSLNQFYCVKELFIGGSSTRSADHTVNSITLNGIDFSEFKKKFIREAQDLAKFRHPNIVQVINIFEANNTAYYVMEYIEGITLKECVEQNGPYHRSKAIPVMRQLLDAVEEVHRKGMLHRDIKPSNVIVTSEERLVLIDFGSAREFQAGQAATQTAMITPGYSPWEQYSEQGKRDATSDIYALGATMYFLLTGERPLAAPDRIEAELSAPHEINPKVDTQISSAVLLAMEMRPANRFQTIADFRSALDVLSEGSTSSPNEGAPHPPGKGETPKKKNRAAVWVLLILLLFGGGGAAYYFQDELIDGLTARMDEEELQPRDVAIRFIEHLNLRHFKDAKEYAHKSFHDMLDEMERTSTFAPTKKRFQVDKVSGSNVKGQVSVYGRTEGESALETVQLIQTGKKWMVFGLQGNQRATEVETTSINDHMSLEEELQPRDVAIRFVEHYYRRDFETAKVYAHESIHDQLDEVERTSTFAPTQNRFEVDRVSGGAAKGLVNVDVRPEGESTVVTMLLVHVGNKWLVYGLQANENDEEEAAYWGDYDYYEEERMGPGEVAEVFIYHVNNMEFEEAKQYGTVATNDILDLVVGFAGMASEKPEFTGFEILFVEEAGDTATVVYRNEGADADETLSLVKVDDDWRVDINKEDMNKEDLEDVNFDSIEND